jgi:hypothetical protein
MGFDGLVMGRTSQNWSALRACGNKAHFLYLTRNAADRGQLLKSVVLKCATDGISLAPSYRKPFDLIFERAKTENWPGREDLNLRPLVSKIGFTQSTL